MYPHKTPLLIQKFFKAALWRRNSPEKALYLTFDDGPQLGVTDWVLDQLADYNAKATFFCVGENVVKNPDLYKRILEEGHSVGNHSFNHLDGWKTNFEAYIENVEKAADCIDTKYFRAPYGKLTWKQYRYLVKRYTVVFWDVMPGDFDKQLSEEKVIVPYKKKRRRGLLLCCMTI